MSNVQFHQRADFKWYGEQLTDETINLAVKIIKNQYSFWNGFEDTIFDQFDNKIKIKIILSKYFTLIING